MFDDLMCWNWKQRNPEVDFVCHKSDWLKWTESRRVSAQISGVFDYTLFLVFFSGLFTYLFGGFLFFDVLSTDFLCLIPFWDWSTLQNWSNCYNETPKTSHIYTHVVIRSPAKLLLYFKDVLEGAGPGSFLGWTRPERSDRTEAGFLPRQWLCITEMLNCWC